MKRQKLLSLVLLCLFGVTLAAQNHLIKKVESQSVASTIAKLTPQGESKVIMELDFDEPKVVKATLPNGTSVERIAVEKRDYQNAYFTYPIPFFSYVVQGHILSARIVSASGQGTLSANLPFDEEAESDTPIGADELERSNRKNLIKPNDVFPKKQLEWFFGGSMRGVDVSSLSVSPYIYNPNTKTLSYTKKLTIEVVLATTHQNAQAFKIGINEQDVLSQTPAKREPYQAAKYQATSLNRPPAPLMQNIQSNSSLLGATQSAAAFSGLPVAPKYRIIVNQDGLYRIGYFEFLDGGLPQEFLNSDPRTYRVFNKGVEVPIFVRGENDGRFNRDDFIEFFGERHQIGKSDSTRPDMYRDPFSEENVYYLYWETISTPFNRGLRLTEISGEIRDNIREARFLPGGDVFRSFRTTAHYEFDAGDGALQFGSITSGDSTILIPFVNSENRLSGFYDEYRSQAYRISRNHSDQRDKLFWTEVALNRSVDTPIPVPYPDITAPAPGLTNDYFVDIAVAFHGQSKVPSIRNSQNIASVSLSGRNLLTTEWGIGSNSQIPHIRRIQLPQTNRGDFRTGATDVSQILNLNIRNDDAYREGNEARKFSFNWFEISYMRLYRAYQNELSFRTPPRSVAGRYQFRIGGFTSQNIDLYKKGVGKITNFVLRPYRESVDGNPLEEEFFQIIFQDDVVNPENVEYLAIDASKKKLPVRFEKVDPADYYNPSRRFVDKTNNYNFILITSNKFISEQTANNPANEIFQYKQHRESVLAARGENSNVLVTTVESIYDEFNFGIRSPHAIRNFLDYAYHEWQSAPTYVLLVGETRFGRVQPGDVPTFHVQTIEFGATPSDSWFAMIDGIDATEQLDLIPDMQIARLPVSRREEIGFYLEKLKKYELSPAVGAWENKILLIGGEAEGTSNVSGADGSTQQNNKLIQTDSLVQNYINRALFIDRLHTGIGRLKYDATLGFDRYIGSTPQLVSAVNQGYAVVNFMGHGGGAIWGDSRLFDVASVSLLDNFNTLPFVTSFTCFVGAIDIPNPLSRAFVLSRRKGSIGIIASAGYGWFLNDFLMAQGVYEFLFNEQFQGLTIGDMLFRGKIRYYLRNINIYPQQAPSQMHQYGIVGDPAVRLIAPKTAPNNRSRIRWKLPTNIAPIGSILKIVGTVDGIQNGTGEGRITDQNNYDVSTEPISFIVQSGKIGQLLNGSFVDTLFVTIPPPPEGRGKMPAMTGGHFKAYIANSDRTDDANGHIAFSTAAPFFRNITPTKNFLTIQNEAQQFQMEVESRLRINRVELDVNVEAVNPAELALDVPADTTAFTTVFRQRLVTNAITPNLYETTDSIPANFMRSPNRLTYQAIAQTDSGQYASNRFIAQVGNPPDLAAVERTKEGQGQLFNNNTIDFYPDGERVVIAAEVYNWSNVAVERAIVYFYENSISNATFPNQSPYIIRNQLRLIDTTSISLSPLGKATAKIPVPSWMNLFESYKIGFKVLADTTGQQFESTYSNNLSNQRTVQFNLLRVQPTATFAQLDQNLILRYDNGTFLRNGFLRVTKISNPKKVSQPDNIFARLAVQNAPSERLAYRIEAADSALTLSKPLSFEIKLSPDEPADQRDQIFGFIYAEPIERWLKLPEQSRRDSLTYVIQSLQFGSFALMRTTDAQKPIVSLGIEGQTYLRGTPASRRPRITVTVQDQNGIYLDASQITIIRNADSSESVKYKLTIPTNTGSANAVAMTYDDEFPTGEQALQFVFHDANLNEVRSEVMVFNVGGDFSLDAKGAYPNPFDDETFIVYNITGDAESFELKIYTVSGRLIATLRSAGVRNQTVFPVNRGASDGANGSGDLFSPGPHAVAWTGKDESGTDVANGVYYGKLRITFQGKVAEKIIKIVRLR